MTMAMKMTLTQEETADYLNISVDTLAKHVKRGDLRLHSQGKRKYHLAGEVEVLQSLIINAKPKPPIVKQSVRTSSYCGRFRD